MRYYNQLRLMFKFSYRTYFYKGDNDYIRDKTFFIIIVKSKSVILIDISRFLSALN